MNTIVRPIERMWLASIHMSVFSMRLLFPQKNLCQYATQLTIFNNHLLDKILFCSRMGNSNLPINNYISAIL